MFRAKVRGIYSTALTRILLDNGFKIIQPSTPIKERFKLTDTSEDTGQPDLEVNDRFDKQGVNAVGYAVAVERFALILFDLLDDVIIRRQSSMFTPLQVSDSSSLNLTEILSETCASTSYGRIQIDIEFPGLSKRKLDEIRSMVVPTLSGHHYYKACGGKIAYILEMAEKLLEKGCSNKEVETLFKEAIWHEYPCEGSKVSIEHVKLNGKLFHLGEARIIELNEQNRQIKLLRVLSTPGIYDGLNVRKEPGDYAVTNMKINEWHFRTSYFSKSGEYKGTYVNLNTPIEIYPNRIRYVDLEADICMWPDGRIQKIDSEKLDEAVRKGYISERLKRKVHGEIEEILKILSPDLEKEAVYAVNGVNERINL